MSTAVYAARRNQNLYRRSTKLELGPVSVGFVMIAIISVLALLYLTQITKTSVYGYRLSELTARQAKLTAANQEMQVEAARLRSIQQIKATPAVAHLVPETKVNYAQ
ncbi:MAG TPA: hypothetical protein VK963_03475 [Candidatus Saccharimonadales bacterium]|nr:hypothetical protein [Candidatus Saccharimonadales bacterium]